ncbi:MAG TPA: alpha/beta fold hydrolase [Thermoanaerobaculia bacterium]|nr:alpha/beta fold hydrolase [Thermoanaerobaculia bacterium]
MHRIVVVALLLFALPLLAQPVTIELDSKIMGEKRTLLVSLPASYETGEHKYPVLYMTDGAAQLPHTAATVEFLARNGRVPELIVVGINNTDRSRDLTPTRVVGQTFDGRPYSFPTSGAADRFLSFIESEVIPEIEKRYRTQPYRVFAGHSFGGLFALHALFSKPQLFNAWIAVSPTLIWDHDYVERRARTFVNETKELNATLVFTLGDEDAIKQQSERLKKLFERRKPKGFEVATFYFADEDHGSVVLPSHYDALRRIFAPWRFTLPAGADPRTLYAKAEAHYASVSKRAGYSMPIPEVLTNAIGYQLLGAGHHDQAIEVLRRNVEAYPHSANVYDSLGEALEKSGKLEEARASYERAWQRGKETNDPNTPVFQANYERLNK